MDIQRLSTDYKNFPMNTVQNRTIMAEVVVIDEIDPARPVVYLLRDEISNEIENGLHIDDIFFGHRKELFFQIGEARSIDRNTHTIILENNNRVTCKHLIIAKGDPSVDKNQEAFRPALNALATALRVCKKRFNNQYRNQKRLEKKHQATHLKQSESEEGLYLLEMIASTIKGRHSTPHFNQKGRRLFEVIP